MEIPSPHELLAEKEIYASEWNQPIPLRVIQISSAIGRGYEGSIVLQQGVNFVMRTRLLGASHETYDLTNRLVIAKIRESDAHNAQVLEHIREGFAASPGRGVIKNYLATGGFFDLILNAEETRAMTWDSGILQIDLMLISNLAQITFPSAAWTTATLDIDNDSGQGTLTGSGGTANPFTGVVVGDLIRIAGSSNSVANGTYTVAARTDSALTFTKKIGYGAIPSATANIAHTTNAFIIQIATLDDDNVTRVSTDQIRIARQVTQ